MSFYRPHKRVALDLGVTEVTKQSHKDECDINRILKQYQKTGLITHVQSARPTYTDLPNDIDFQSAMNTIIKANDVFADLPAKVRAAFDNDPATFLAAFDDPSQAEKLREYGLLNPLAPEATSAPPAPPPAPTPSPTPKEPSASS